MVYISKFILASTSPRRRDLLHLIGADFQIEAPAEEEPQTTCTDPEEYVSLLSYNKAMSIVKRGAELPVVAADTIVTIDGNILGKPLGEDDASRTLQMLSGRWHRVYTGITVHNLNEVKTEVEKNDVKFRDLSKTEIRAYIATGEPIDKAGSYGIQGKGALFVEQINGDYYNVVGMPLVRLLRMMRELRVISSEGFLETELH